MRPSLIRTALVPAALAAATLLLPSCQKKPGGRPPARPVPVVIGTVARKTMPVEAIAVGNVEAYSSVAVKPQVTGVLLEVHFREGQDVAAGNLLFSLDPAPFEIQLRQAEATLARDTAQLANARVEAGRYRELVEKGYVARQEYDRIRTAADVLEATVRADSAVVDSARLQLGYCAVRAPIAGRTGSLLVKEGNLVRANDTSLVTINQVQPVFVSFGLPEQYLADIRRHTGTLRIRATADGTAGEYAEQGKLAFVDNAVDPASGMIRLKASLANRERRFWPGQFVNITVVFVEETGAVVVPSRAVQSGQRGAFVFVVKPDMTVEMRPVTTARTVGQETVIGAGLAGGEEVVLDGHMRLFPGAKVEPKQEESARAETAVAPGRPGRPGRTTAPGQPAGRGGPGPRE